MCDQGDLQLLISQPFPEPHATPCMSCGQHMRLRSSTAKSSTCTADSTDARNDIALHPPTCHKNMILQASALHAPTQEDVLRTPFTINVFRIVINGPDAMHEQDSVIADKLHLVFIHRNSNILLAMGLCLNCILACHITF